MRSQEVSLGILRKRKVIFNEMVDQYTDRKDTNKSDKIEGIYNFMKQYQIEFLILLNRIFSFS